jgi:hypothetical protein
VKFFLDENFPGSQARNILSMYPGSIYARKDDRFSGKSDPELYRFLCRDRMSRWVKGDIHEAG